ncbi:MAG: UDP-N-acetylmuramate dehydrogenase [Magnetococcales bacterium]|nr:UDP-N-acetylmuramate dehydrogenase [Magnetococcales bacterium]
MGGPARWLVQPVDLAELAGLLAGLARLEDGPPHEQLPWVVLGGGSNLLVDDAGYPGVVIDLTRGCGSLVRQGATILAGAGVTTRALAHFARREGLTGAEFLAGIPGTIGGALRMNAGAYGGDMARMLEQAEVMDPRGERHRRTPEQLGMGYRTCNLPADWLFTGAEFRLTPGDPQAIRQRMRELNQRRRQSQPLEFPSAGSVFKNPPGTQAWRLIREAGLAGVRRGRAEISERHCNFFINRGGARAADMMALMAQARAAVRQRTGVVLEPEVRLLGGPGWVLLESPASSPDRAGG